MSPDGKWVAAAAMTIPEAFPRLDKGFDLKLVVRKILDVPDAPKVIDLPGFTVEPHWLRIPDGESVVVVARATNPGRTAYKHSAINPKTGAPQDPPPDWLDDARPRVLDFDAEVMGYLCEHRDAEKKTAKLVLLASPLGDKFILLTDLKSPPGSVAARFSPDGKKVLFTDGDPARKDAHKWGKSQRPYLFDVATGKREPLVGFPEDGQAVGVCWSPDGKRVAYTWTRLHADLLATDGRGDDPRRQTDGFLVVADADGRNARAIATDKGRVSSAFVFGQVDWR